MVVFHGASIVKIGPTWNLLDQSDQYCLTTELSDLLESCQGYHPQLDHLGSQTISSQLVSKYIEHRDDHRESQQPGFRIGAHDGGLKS